VVLRASDARDRTVDVVTPLDQAHPRSRKSQQSALCEVREALATANDHADLCIGIYRATYSIRHDRASYRESWSGAGGHVGGEYVVWVAVEVLAGPVIAHGGSRVRVAGGDLDIAQVDPGVKHGRDECVPQHMGMKPGDPDSRCFGEPSEPPGGCAPVHPRAVAVEQDRPGGAVAHGAVDGPAGTRGHRGMARPAPAYSYPPDNLAVPAPRSWPD
jgi:hypothetical protein